MNLSAVDVRTLLPDRVRYGEIYVRVADAVAALVVPSDIIRRLPLALFIVLNPLPLVPDEPDEPDVPDVPDVPEVPDVPSIPDVPELPELPDEPDVPDVPEVTDVPFIPDIVTGKDF